MEGTEWQKINFQEFMNKFGANLVIETAPIILYPKKDQEHKASNSLIAFFIIASILCLYISLSLLLIESYFNIILFLIITAILGVIDIFLLINYIKSNVYIKPFECWVEIFKKGEFYCFSYYPIFSGKCHPNKAKNIIYKLYQEEVLKSRIDITQIEIYLKQVENNSKNFEKIGFYFQYGKDKGFRDEEVNRNSWYFFAYDFSLNDNYIATANWDHQYEWHSDLELDIEKLNNFGPWIIKRWDQFTLKPLHDQFKEKLQWEQFNIDSRPKLKPWDDDLEKQTYQNQNANKDLTILNEAITKIMGKNIEIKKISDLENQILKFKIYFRDLKF